MQSLRSKKLQINIALTSFEKKNILGVFFHLENQEKFHTFFFNIIGPTQAKNKKIQIFKTDIVLICYYVFNFNFWSICTFQQAFLKTSTLEPSEALHNVCISNITKPLRILYQISKLFLNFGYILFY